MVVPCHCSGDPARRAFENAYGKNFIRVGKRLEIETGKGK
jgi:metal-dependent hydrolase (beta-lactamase superfamily II)